MRMLVTLLKLNPIGDVYYGLYFRGILSTCRMSSVLLPSFSRLVSTCPAVPPAKGGRLSWEPRPND